MSFGTKEPLVRLKYTPDISFFEDDAYNFFKKKTKK